MRKSIFNRMKGMIKISPAIASLVAVFPFISMLIAGCGGRGGGGDSENVYQTPSISIEVPTSASSYSTTWSSVRLGGTISHASFVHIRNTSTGAIVEGYVNYNQGYGSWFADVYGLRLGDNTIMTTADADGTGARTASVHITVTRPLQPADFIINGPDHASANTFWTDGSSFNNSHNIAFFGDGTGKSTTGSVLSENAGTAIDFTWSKLGPDSILISNCLTCSFQNISRIEGSLSEGIFLGQVETIGGVGELALHAFTLMSGNL